jgi:hypothetical protein
VGERPVGRCQRWQASIGEGGEKLGISIAVVAKAAACCRSMGGARGRVPSRRI